MIYHLVRIQRYLILRIFAETNTTSRGLRCTPVNNDRFCGHRLQVRSAKNHVALTKSGEREKKEEEFFHGIKLKKRSEI